MKQESEIFKICTTCKASWPCRDDFLADRNVVLIGYQPYFESLGAGLFLFNHVCGTTLAIPVADFAGLYDGPVYESRLYGTDECPGYCLRQKELRPCPGLCECAFVREVIQRIRNWADAEA